MNCVLQLIQNHDINLSKAKQKQSDTCCDYCVFHLEKFKAELYENIKKKTLPILNIKAFFLGFFINIPVDTGRKLNVHETFGRRPGRLLNVLCTFNLCPVSTGMLLQRLGNEV